MWPVILLNCTWPFIHSSLPKSHFCFLRPHMDFPFLEHVTFLSNSGTLHVQCPLPGILFSQLIPDSHSSHAHLDVIFPETLSQTLLNFNCFPLYFFPMFFSSNNVSSFKILYYLYNLINYIKYLSSL
jgi:hypothetical protein